MVKLFDVKLPNPTRRSGCDHKCSQDFRCGEGRECTFFTSRADDFFSHCPQYACYPPKL